MSTSAYSFLDPHKEGAFLAVYIVGIAIGECVIFAIVQGLCIFREWLISRSQPPQHSSTLSPSEVSDDWQTVERPGTPMAV
jgi:hypothetical protein